MRVSEAYGPGKFGLSFELYPPKSAPAEHELFEHLGQLMLFEPSFVTCTYGAGGSTRTKTLDIVERVRRDFGASVAAHLTCVGSTAEDLRTFLADAARRGIENIVALRGDPPRDQTHFTPVEGGFCYASELVSFIRGEFPEFGIAVAGYPETHRESPSPGDDLANLRRKVDAGGDVVITQLFYSNDDFFRFRDRCTEVGISTPIVPGLLPVTNLAQIQRITTLCGARLPAEFTRGLEAQQASAEGQFRVGVDFAVAQLQELVDAGVPGVHFYVLNKSPATAAILRQVALPR